MVCVAGLAHLKKHGVGGLPCLDDVPTLLDHLLEGLGRVEGEVGVAHDADVLDGVRHAVELPVVLRGRDRLGREFRLLVGGKVDGLHRTVLDQLPEPVMGADDDVRPLPGIGRVLEVLADVRRHLHLHLDALLLTELGAVLVKDGLAVVVAPDHEVHAGVPDRGGGRRGGRRGSRGRGRAGPRRARRARRAGRGGSSRGRAATRAHEQRSCTGESDSAKRTLVHGFSFEAGGRRPPSRGRKLARRRPGRADLYHNLHIP